MVKQSGQAWRQLIEDSPTTQKAVAAAVGISQHHLSRIINGNTNASPQVIVKFARTMGVDPFDLACLQAKDQIAQVLESGSSGPSAT